MHIKDLYILNRIKDFFGCGSVTFRTERKLAVYRVTKLANLLSVIIPHFLAYPLVSQKQLDFNL